ncbi:hypothetical protein D3C71_1328440 [compost metagenome]
MLGHHLGRIAAIVGKVACADIKAQPALHRTGARNALLQNLHAHTQIAHGVKGSKVPAKVLVLVGVHIGHHLHQPLGANGTLCKRVEARFDGHDGKDQGRVDLGLCANFIGLGHQHAQRLRGHTVLLAEPEGDGSLLFGQVLGVARRGALTGFWFDGHAKHFHLAGLQPVHQLCFTSLAQVRAGREGDHDEGDSQADEGKAVVGDFKKTFGHVGHEGPHAGDYFS